MRSFHPKAAHTINAWAKLRASSRMSSQFCKPAELHWHQDGHSIWLDTGFHFGLFNKGSMLDRNIKYQNDIEELKKCIQVCSSCYFM